MKKVYTIEAIGFEKGVDCPHSGMFLEEFDFEYDNGLGYGVFTSDPSCAKHFQSAADAMVFWRTISTTRPTRPDGKPNRPLTALTIAINPYEVEG